jgi:regulator of protease activity HflC (stomatin/prohibitin superfamily)
MDSALAWIGQIAEWIGRWIPRLEIVSVTHAAVKFRRGNEVTSLPAGLHVYWPLITEFRTYPIARQTVDLRPQKLTTKDDRTVLVGALIAYIITDIEKILAHTWDPEETLRDAALRAVTRVVLGFTWEELKQEARKGTLDTKLRKEAQKALLPYGVEVQEMSLTDLAATKVYSLVQSSNSI